MDIQTVNNINIPTYLKVIACVLIAILVFFALFKTSKYGSKRFSKSKRGKHKPRFLSKSKNIEIVEDDEKETTVNAVVITKRTETVNTLQGPVTIYYMGLMAQDRARKEERISGSIYGTILVGDAVTLIYKGDQIQKITLIGHVDPEKIMAADNCLKTM